MSILSNYVPNCIVRAEVSAREELAENTYSIHKILQNFVQAVQIAEVEPLEQ
jgi:hydroxymethylglutaryl-CoA reductase